MQSRTAFLRFLRGEWTKEKTDAVVIGDDWHDIVNAMNNLMAGKGGIYFEARCNGAGQYTIGVYTIGSDGNNFLGYV